MEDEEIRETPALSFRERVLPFYEKFMYAVGILGPTAFFVQAFKIFFDRSAKDVSLASFVMTTIACSSWLFYGYLIRNKVLIAINTFAVIGTLLTLLGIIIYS